MDEGAAETQSGDLSPRLASLAATYATLSDDRAANEYDILVQTVLETLSDGPAERGDLLARVRSIWPGAPITVQQVDVAAALAEQAGLIARSGAKATLTMLGARDVERSRARAETVAQSTALEIARRATQALIPADRRQATRWLGILTYGLLQAIAGATAAFRGDVVSVASGSLAPVAVDLTALDACFAKLVKSPEVRDFLRALAVDALDPAAAFGDELVSAITTGYVLHAFIARGDSSARRAALGSMRGRVAIVDTPVLLPLVGSSRLAAPVQDAIATAVELGAVVIVPRHCIAEINALYARMDRSYAATLESAIRGGASPGVLRRLAEEQPIEVFLAAFEQGEVKTWGKFRQRVSELAANLTRLGAVIQEQTSTDEMVARFENQLTAAVAAGRYDRGVDQIRHDAMTMTMAFRVRESNPQPTTALPAAWVVTTDLRMPLAYRRTVRGDPQTVAIAPSRWVAALAAFAEPATAEQLASHAAALVGQETMLRIATRFPVRVAIQIAASLQSQGEAAEFEVRAAQMSLDELAASSDLQKDQIGAMAFAAGVMDRRAKRLELLDRHEQERAGQRIAELEAQASAARELAILEREAAEQARRGAGEERSRREKVEADSDARVMLERRRWLRRLSLAAMLVFSAVPTALATGWLGTPLAATATGYALGVGTLLSAVLFWIRTAEWIRNPGYSIRQAAIAAVGEAVVLAGLVVDLIRMMASA